MKRSPTDEQTEHMANAVIDTVKRLGTQGYTFEQIACCLLGIAAVVSDLHKKGLHPSDIQEVCACAPSTDTRQ